MRFTCLQLLTGWKIKDLDILWQKKQAIGSKATTSYRTQRMTSGTPTLAPATVSEAGWPAGVPQAA